MATVNNISEKKQTPSAQRGVIEYCIQAHKTVLDEETVFVTGVNCVTDLAHESFLATQKIFDHSPDGPRFYHYVQSFSPYEDVSPETVHEIGLELAKAFGNREVLVATHIDRDHLHNHFVVNSYDLDTGTKLHANLGFLCELRNRSDEICKAHGLSTLDPYTHKRNYENLGQKEYRAAIKGESWKMRLCFVIDECMKFASNKDEFIEAIRARGYDVVWTDERKYITYIIPTEEGKNPRRVRDIKLHEEKYLKENMENEFRIKQGEAKRSQGNECTEGKHEHSNNSERGLGHDSQNSSANGDDRSRNARGDEGMHSRDGSQGERAHGMDNENAEANKRDHRQTNRESERRGYYGNKRQNGSRRENVVGKTRPIGSSIDNSAALHLVARLGSHAGNIVADSDETEEERKIREANNAGAAVGLAVAAGIKIFTAYNKEEALPEYEEIDEGEDEDSQGFCQTM